MNKVSRYFRGVVEQGKMVRWPKRKELFQAVGIVIGVVLVAAIALVISDWIISGLLKALEGQAGTSASSAAAIKMILPRFFF
jgi:preprotein translocase SecE subunit